MMHELGVEVLIVSNACGGLNPNYAAGDIMVVAEQLNLMFRNPLISDSSECCPRGLPFRPTYDVELITTAQEVARQRGILIHKGVYAAVAGPNYETRAEIRMLRQLGADVVGMSTVPEVIVARQLGLRVLGLSAVTNKCSADSRVETSGDHVIVAAESTQPKLRDIVLGVINRL